MYGTIAGILSICRVYCILEETLCNIENYRIGDHLALPFLQDTDYADRGLPGSGQLSGKQG